MVIHDTFLRDNRLTPTAHGVGAFIARHIDGAPLAAILDYFRDAPLTLAHACDELEAAGYVTRIAPDDATDAWQVVYVANPDTLGGVNAA